MFLRLYVSIFNESLFQSLYVTIIALILSEKAIKCFIILWLFIVRSALDAVFLWNTKPGFQKYIQLSWFTFVIERPLLFQFSLRQTARLPPFHWGPLRGASLNHAMRASLGCFSPRIRFTSHTFYGQSGCRSSALRRRKRSSNSSRYSLVTA